MEVRENKKERIEDKDLPAGLRDTDLSRKELCRVSAVNQVFTAVTFKQCVFSACYFRNCRFVRCDFTGADIKESNFRGAQFDECIFKYTTWEKTLIDERFLDTCLPSEENLARDLVRSLRVNFSQIGNYEAVNKAASIEVQLTGQHLYNAAYSRQSYYRAKYKGLDRVKHALQHLRWKSLDLLWGNGESILRVVLSGVVVVLVAAAVYMREVPAASFLEAIFGAFGHFWGVQFGALMPPTYVVVLTILRFVLFGLFMAILIKRLSRR